MELEQFAYELHQRVLERCAAEASLQLREDAFTEVVLDQLAEGGGDVCYHQGDRHGRRPASKVNAWNLSADGTALTLFVSLYHGSGKMEVVSRAEVERHFKLLRGFLTRALSGFHVELEESFEAFDAARRIHEVKSDLANVRLVFVTDGVVRSADVEKEQLPGFATSYEFWDLKELRNLAAGEPEPIELDFAKNHGGAVSCLVHKDATGEFTTYLAFFPASLLQKIYAEFGMRLLEKNVRAFLSAKGKVNKPIQETIREEPHRFLAYNNGISATAAAVRVKDKGDGHAQLQWARDFQIVNGGQTTASIHHAKIREHADIANVFVQVKLTVVTHQAMVEEFVPLISKYANSQNKVNTSAFSANSPFHRAVERLSRTITFQPADGLERGTRWYYERAQGSYLNDKNNTHPPAARNEWERTHPTSQKFTKTDLAKFEHTWAGLPHLVCLGAEKNFLKFADVQEADGEPPVDETYFRRLIGKAKLFREAEKLVSAQGLVGYRANTVTYSLAWLVEKSGRRIDLDRIWKEQRLPQGLCEAIATVCRAAHTHILDVAPTFGRGNANEGTKKPECWEVFRNMPITLPPAWETEWSVEPFQITRVDDTALAQEWDRLRPHFHSDYRTLGELEVSTGKPWFANRRQEPVSVYAVMTWEQLCGLRSFAAGKRRKLMDIMTAALALNSVADGSHA